MTRGSPGDCTCDSSCTSAKVRHHMQLTKWTSVGALQRNRKLGEAGREQSLQAVARQMPWQATHPGRVGHSGYGYCRNQMWRPDGKHPGRIGLFWQERDEAEARQALVSHRLLWEVMRLVVG